MEKRYMLAMTATTCMLLWGWAIVAFHKWDAQWWGIGIGVYAMVGMLMSMGIAALLGLLDSEERTPNLVLCGVVLFVLLSLAEGVFISEPALGQPTATNHSVTTSHDEENNTHSSFFYYSWWHEATSSDSSSSAHSSSSKGAGYVTLFLLLLALLLLSAIIPHFWVVAACIGVMLLWCFTIKEYKRASDSCF
ncbi:hypothetical protein KSF_107350 [Reticulibacter mediterranei]|uniref:Uncharacterized protein n=1 Tax=Reticulibacter mediterranei TaxID=2778369 RepID=A0A8J3N6T0_9CHLR|nr:hypothetical protein [Reticulibacter mediterranei]GHP00688.1 hypothetical protein KSF_107350 [Reticulibacter mediterranei]